MKNSRAKGAAAERELAEQFRSMGFTNAHRTQQYCGAAGDSDVSVPELPGIHIESKRVERLNIDTAMEQAVRDSSVLGHIPVVCHRRNGKGWLVTIRMTDLAGFASRVDRAFARLPSAELPG